MRGAIAAGSETTAQAGVEALQAGGNAVDAVVAACFATAAGEPTLTSLAGGGVMLHRDAGSGAVTICDFFANAPGLGGRAPERLDFFPQNLRFGPATQAFHVGAGAAAVPGVVPGLCSAQERWGRLPLAEVVAPACRFLREGVRLTPWQETATAVLEPILFQTPAGRRQFGVEGRLMAAGDRYALPQLAATLEALAAGDWRHAYREIFWEAFLDQFGPRAGGLLGAEDLRAYRVDLRPPLEVSYRGARVYTNPPPGAGGAMIALMLALLEEAPVGGLEPGGAEHVAVLCRAMRVADEARAVHPPAGLMDDLPRWRRRFRELAGQPLGSAPPVAAGRGSTTHVSVVDEAGGAAAVTFSHGEGNGILVGDTGVMMNNLMGEEDLFPAGFHRWPPGRRLATMMAPSLAEAPDGTLTVLGSGGANRIRTALTQALSALLDHGMVPAVAVGCPRVHFERGVLNAEEFGRPAGGAFLAELGAGELVRFPEPNLFFGGVHLVQRSGDGALGGAGDPRRGGVCRLA